MKHFHSNLHKFTQDFLCKCVYVCSSADEFIALRLIFWHIEWASSSITIVNELTHYSATFFDGFYLSRMHIRLETIPQ